MVISVLAPFPYLFCIFPLLIVNLQNRDLRCLMRTKCCFQSFSMHELFCYIQYCTVAILIDTSLLVKEYLLLDKGSHKMTVFNLSTFRLSEW